MILKGPILSMALGKIQMAVNWFNSLLYVSPVQKMYSGGGGGGGYSPGGYYGWVVITPPCPHPQTFLCERDN